MAKRIVYDYEALSATSANLRNFAEEIKREGTALLTNIENATEKWEGDSKTKFINVMQSTVKKYVEITFPDAVKEFANVLDQDAKAMKTADEEVAKGISV